MKNATRGTKAILVILLCCLLISVGFNVWYLRNQWPSGYELSSCRNQLQSAEDQMSSLQTQLSSYQSQLQSAENQVSSLQTQLSSYQSQVSSLQSELSVCQRYGQLQEWSLKAEDKTVNQDHGTKSGIVQFTADYAGYVQVSGTSTTSNGYIMVTCSFSGYPYNDTEYLFGTGTTRLIPVLPGTIRVYFGNHNLVHGATATITVYYVC